MRGTLEYCWVSLVLYTPRYLVGTVVERAACMYRTSIQAAILMTMYIPECQTTDISKYLSKT